MAYQSGLDLYLSTSQKAIESDIEQSYGVQSATCDNHAPYICFQDTAGMWRLVQGCCNDWLCGRCGQIRARHEFARIAYGATLLMDMGHSMYFVTVTCRGKDLDVSTSDDDYLLWTNRLFSTWRARCKKEGGHWAYVQVTERQQRGAAHSHIITTHHPNDGKMYNKGDMLPNGIVAKHDCLYSDWFVAANQSAGLGKATDCTEVRSVVGVTSYVSKYLFKDMQSALWPKGWRRLRYSQSWPKLPEHKNDSAFPVVRYKDWQRVMFLGTVVADSEETYEKALSVLATNVVPPKRRTHA